MMRTVADVRMRYLVSVVCSGEISLHLSPSLGLILRFPRENTLSKQSSLLWMSGVACFSFIDAVYYRLAHSWQMKRLDSSENALAFLLDENFFSHSEHLRHFSCATTLSPARDS